MSRSKIFGGLIAVVAVATIFFVYKNNYRINFICFNNANSLYFTQSGPSFGTMMSFWVEKYTQKNRRVGPLFVLGDPAFGQILRLLCGNGRLVTSSQDYVVSQIIVQIYNGDHKIEERTVPQGDMNKIIDILTSYVKTVGVPHD